MQKKEKMKILTFKGINIRKNLDNYISERKANTGKLSAKRMFRARCI